MAVLGEAFAALLAEIEERVGVTAGGNSFLALPATARAIAPSGLTFDPQQLVSEQTPEGEATSQSILNQAHFALMVDAVSDGGPQISASAGQMSGAYEDALLQAVMPPSDDRALEVAKRFGERRSALNTARRSAVALGGARFFETRFEPPVNVEDTASWTPLALDAAAITQQGATLSPPMRELLNQSGMMADVGAVVLTSTRVEVCVLSVVRPWFDRSLFEDEEWDLPGEPLSDGADPPRGRIPAYIEGLVLARDFRIQLDVATDSASMPEGVIARIGPGDPAVVTPIETATSQIPLPALVDARAVAEQKRVLGEQAARVLADLEAEIGKRVAEIAALTARANDLRADLSQYPPDLMVWEPDPNNRRDHRSPRDLRPAREELAAAEARILVADSERIDLERQAAWQRDVVNDLGELVASYAALARPEERPIVTVLAFLCRKPPRAPNPNTALFPPDH
jgi:hypothetical protein